MINNLKTRKMYYAFHIIRNTSEHYDTGSKRYDQIKRAAERRDLDLHGTVHEIMSESLNYYNILLCFGLAAF